MRRVLLVATIVVGTLATGAMASSCANDAFSAASGEDASLESSPDEGTSPDSAKPDGGSGACGPSEKNCIVCIPSQSPATGCDPQSCATCNIGSHAEAGCFGTACGIGSCESPYLDCDDSGATGCEVNPLRGDPNNCGACGRTCEGGLLCELDGGCASSCTTGTPCAGGCVDVASDPNNCNGCGTVCAGEGTQHATVGCANKICSFQCSPGFSDCNANPSDGCECNLATSSCVSGVCQPSCTPFFSGCSASTACCAAAFGQPVCGDGSICCMPSGAGCGNDSWCCSGAAGACDTTSGVPGICH